MTLFIALMGPETRPHSFRAAGLRLGLMGFSFTASTDPKTGSHFSG
jgi:hypothetical protein